MPPSRVRPLLQALLGVGALALASACVHSVQPTGPDEAGLALAASDSIGSCNGLVPTIVADSTGFVLGTPEADVIVGSAGPDSIYGGSGNDTICGLAGNDWIDGEGGNDTIHGNAGNDSLFGGDGDDTITGDDHDDLLDGGPGNDRLFGGNGSDQLYGQGGEDRLWGELRADSLDGGDGHDTLDGGRDTDQCVTGTDNLIRCEILIEPPPPPGPNFLVIITDDHRFDSYRDYMPITYSRIAQEGVEFDHGYVTTPLCCPSRSSIMTGMYARHHGVTTNNGFLLHPTVVQRLHAAGYYTGQVGKYLNSCCANPPPEFDFWASWAADGGTYIDPKLNVNGVVTQRTGYSTHILREYALQFLDAEVAAGRPFLLLFSPLAPHLPSTPAPEDEGRYATLPPHRPPSFNEADISDKPAWLPLRPFSSGKAAYIDQERRNMLATLWSVDQAIGAILDRLEELGQLDGTMIVFISDNGWLWGEHRIIDRKNLLYEEAARVPFLVRYPPLITVPRLESRLVANIDIAPTLYELAGLPIPPEVDGRSLVPLLQGGVPVRDDLLLEAWNSATSAPWLGVHTETHVYIEREGDRPELYDMVNDPYQLQNVADDPAYAAILSDLRARLSAY